MLNGNDGADLIFGDYALLQYDILSPNLSILRSIMSLNCSIDDGPQQDSTNDASG